jgi:hypothetical protein
VNTCGNGLGNSFTIDANPVINLGPGADDLGDSKDALADYARILAQEVREIIEIDFEPEAVV